MITTINIANLKLELLKKAKNKLEEGSTNKRILRLEIEIPFTDSLQWLNVQSDSTKIFFSERDSDDCIAGVGIAHMVQTSDINDQDILLNEIITMLNGSKSKYYGGIAFPEKSSGIEWESFGKLKFIIPKFEIINKLNKTYFISNVFLQHRLTDELEKLEKDFNKLNFNFIPIDPIIEKPVEVEKLPNYKKWVKTIENATDDIKSGKYNKIVLARKIVYKFKNKINPIDIMINLKNNLFNRYDFIFQFERDITFLGSSMERLYKRTKLEIKSEGIAGSIKRGLDKNGDKELSNKLFNSKKDNMEQDFVVSFIQKKLSVLCSKLTCSKKEILKLKETSHLKSEFNGYLKDNITDIDLINCLHPTPAVGGDPWDVVSALIYKHETFFRGWYAGIIGYIGADSADFSVALRSGLIYNNILTLYTGVGIVEGSEPKHEWEEGNWKIKNYEDIFN